MMNASLAVFKLCQKHGVCNREVRFNQAGRHVLPLLGERAGVRASVPSDMCDIYNTIRLVSNIPFIRVHQCASVVK